MSLSSYGKIYNLGHKAIYSLFESGTVSIEEKIDGSQISFGRRGNEYFVRSKGQNLTLSAPEKMFVKAVDTVMALNNRLIDGYTYRGEYLQKPKHNVLAYDRVPAQNIIIFDIMTNQEQDYVPYDLKAELASHLGLEIVPQFKCVYNLDAIQNLLQDTSILGGQKIEGVVIKNYDRFGTDGKILMGKLVSAEFKEIHGGEWRAANPTKKDVIQLLIERYKTPTRWNKAVQHLREDGKITNAPADIGPLIREVQNDTFAECGDEIKEALYDWAKAQIARGMIGGLPEWYKSKLAEGQFNGT